VVRGACGEAHGMEEAHCGCFATKHLMQPGARR
jgi:hypothetical protein